MLDLQEKSMLGKIDFDLRTVNKVFVMTESSVSMRQTCSISFSAALGGAETFSTHLDPAWYNYDVQGKYSSCRLLPKPGC